VNMNLAVYFLVILCDARYGIVVKEFQVKTGPAFTDPARITTYLTIP
jgi:hypothetical protein